MANRFRRDEQVLVPAARLPHPDRQPFALMPRKVLGQEGRSVLVDDGDGSTVKIASRLVHSSELGFLVLRIGDLSTETTLLDPLAKSVLQFLRLLVPDNDVRHVPMRTLAELDAHWTAHHGATSHVVIVGHGNGKSLSFLDGPETTGGQLAARLNALAVTSRPKAFISLACLSGRAAFAKEFSANRICRELVAPFDSVHGAAASQFCQRLLAIHLLEGKELGYAFGKAARTQVGGTHFRRWKNGSMDSGGGAR